MLADEHSDGQEAEEDCICADSATKVKCAKDRIASLDDCGCGDRQPRDHLADLHDWLCTIAQLVGDCEAVSTAVDICEAKISKAISEEDSSLFACLLMSIRKTPGTNIGPVGQKGKDRKGRGAPRVLRASLLPVRAPDPSPGVAGSRAPALVRATKAGRLLEKISA